MKNRAVAKNMLHCVNTWGDVGGSCSGMREMMMMMDGGSESLKKRKVVGEGDRGREKRGKASGSEEGESKAAKASSSRSNSKGSEVQKPDYIHVRARRGQATDSHSLAERVRREKISERMKYLQDLVPGCNKITGKAGMLDEIINYVQSLQRQVEFLSLKLAAVNPTLDFDIDDLFAKEVFPSCAPNFATIGMAPPPPPSSSSSSSEMANSAAAYLDFNSAQQLVSCCNELNNNNNNIVGMMMNPSDMGLLRRTISAPLSFPETFHDSSSSSSPCFTQILPSSTWEGDFQIQNLYSLAFDQGRTSSFPSQPFTGVVEASNLKMEM